LFKYIKKPASFGGGPYKACCYCYTKGPPPCSAGIIMTTTIIMAVIVVIIYNTLFRIIGMNLFIKYTTLLKNTKNFLLIYFYIASKKLFTKIQSLPKSTTDKLLDKACIGIVT